MYIYIYLRNIIYIYIYKYVFMRNMFYIYAVSTCAYLQINIMCRKSNDIGVYEHSLNDSIVISLYNKCNSLIMCDMCFHKI